MDDPTRLLIVGADPLARAGLARLLADEPGCQVVGQLAASEEWPETLDGFQADVLLWDLGWDPVEPLPELAGLPWPVLALLPADRMADGRLAEDNLAAAAWSAGARGLLPRDAAPEQLATAVLALHQGLAVVDPGLAGALIAAPTAGDSSLAESLTPRETEVLQLLAEGLTNRAIAQQLAISDHTVKFHVNAILAKLGAQSRTEAVVRATRLGLIVL